MSIGHKFNVKQPQANAGGQYTCGTCGNPLFSADKQFEAGCGFPSFWAHIEANVRQQELDSYGRTRTQLVCSRCGTHLGHLFPHALTPSKLRYCISAQAISKEGK
ncbi:peptide-methionine (R)-S-oxide reductase [Pontibacter sp. E15-1]|uniref:peptide-methionine (R)-S-oxide reductase n=1 Tax=Pontibacter sp. E15-1 TaxID=2919918 RepID=UPI001F500C0F|nr:peptide-methionine (R)-S-oxide reductase [Pontibacter sp. E15-1]MCJ8163431.1 peptide-methionine (R)-S-oxide reductase [Pontibacter sp. E15-1]